MLIVVCVKYTSSFVHRSVEWNSCYYTVVIVAIFIIGAVCKYTAIKDACTINAYTKLKI